MLLDSNIIIYITNDISLGKIFQENELYASIATKIEVLGFHKISETEKERLEAFFNSVEILELTENIAEQAIQLRQKKNISLGDAIIASTALVHKLPLVTANVNDFLWIKELEIINPLSEGDA
jgi:predicted nucleic acid-binding protein